MNGSLLLLILAVVPMLLAPLAWALGRKGGQRAIAVMIACSAVEVAALIYLTALAAGGNAARLTWEGFLGMGIRMRADGFRALYAMIASVMWLVTSLFSRDYLRHDHATGRYAFFTLMTLGATVGLFLSDSIYTAFLFFEVMSLASYPWVAHEETPEAMRAAPSVQNLMSLSFRRTMMQRQRRTTTSLLTLTKTGERLVRCHPLMALRPKRTQMSSSPTPSAVRLRENASS